MALHEAQLQPEYGQTPRPAWPVFRLLPSALQNGLQPLALVRRSLSSYSLRSRRRVTSLAMCRIKREDAQVVEVEEPITSPREMDNAEMSGIRWKFARHGRILHIEVLR